MPPRKANQAQFAFCCGDIGPETFQVASYEGQDSISTPYAFTITLTSSRHDVRAEELVNKQASLYVYRNDEYYPYSGVVSQFRFVDRSVAHSTYSVTLQPRLWLLSLNVQTRVFQKMSVDGIVKQVLDDAGLKDYYTFDLNATYPAREYVVQYQETDLNFISRLLENDGIWYFFKEQPVLAEEVKGVNSEKLVVSNKPSSFAAIGGESTIIYRARSGLNERLETDERESVFKAACERRVVSANVFVKNYNYRTPEVDVSSKTQVSGGDSGTVYRYGGDFKKTDEAQKRAEVLAGRIGCEQVSVHGSSHCRGFRAGMRFTMSEHFRDDCNDTFLLKRVIHRGAQSMPRDERNVATYENDFVAIPSAQIDLFRPELRTPVPRVNGVITAMIEANGADYAALDDMGRYKVRMPFDISDAKNYEASKYVRLAQPYSGANYGIHFPSHEGAEMVLACIDGDPNKPVGLGMVPNANTVSPVVGANKEQSVIRTAGSNEIVLDDTDGKQKISITTKAKNAAQFDDEKKRLFLQTTDGNKLDLDDKNEKVAWNAKKHVITMSYASGDTGITLTTESGHVIKIDDKSKMVTIQTKAGHIIQMNDEKKVMLLSDCNGKNTVSLDGQKGLVLETKGKLSISATQDIDIKGANIKMSASSGTINIKAAQDLGLEGMKINQKATTDYKLEALNVSEKAKMKYSVEANMGVELKSSLQTKISGTMTEVSGNAMTTVKGGVVMIN